MSVGWHSSLPWHRIRSAYRSARTAFFTAPRPEGEYILVEGMDPDGVARVYGQQSYAPNWEFSYNKRGEDVNLARVKHEPIDGVDWWQDHLRGWHHEGVGMLLRCHWEAEPTEAPDEHLATDGWDLRRGMINARRVLEARNIEWEMVEWSRDGGVERGT